MGPKLLICGKPDGASSVTLEEFITDLGNVGCGVGFFVLVDA
jgi:hypothetical protein